MFLGQRAAVEGGRRGAGAVAEGAAVEGAVADGAVVGGGRRFGGCSIYARVCCVLSCKGGSEPEPKLCCHVQSIVETSCLSPSSGSSRLLIGHSSKLARTSRRKEKDDRWRQMEADGRKADPAGAVKYRTEPYHAGMAARDDMISYHINPAAVLKGR